MVQKKLRIILLSLLIGISTILATAQTRVTGVVKSMNGEALPGVNVIEKGTLSGTITDENGSYAISTTGTEAILVFSFIGYLSEEIPVNNQTVINVSLVEDIQELGEVVVIGYGTVKKSDLTGAVSSVKTEELRQLSTVNVQQALQGRVAGVTITAQSGEPGSDMKVRVRGTGTINNSDPLYVVDGFPTGSIDYLTPNDIESTEILKDASATAIYGNRGSNGVVIITTKKGKNQKPTVSFNAYTGIQSRIKKLELLNAHEYGEAKMLANLNAGTTNFDTLFSYLASTNYKGTDWQDEVMRKGSIQNYNIGINGGTEIYKFDFSATYNKDNGIVLNTFNDKVFLRLNNQVKINDRITVNAGVSYVNSKRTNYNYSIYGGGIMANALTADPHVPVWADEENGIYGYPEKSERQNAVAIADRLKDNIIKYNKFVGTFNVDINLLKGLTFTSNFGANGQWDNNHTFNKEYFIGDKDRNVNSSLNSIRQESWGWNNSNYLTYAKEIGKNNLTLMAGQEWSYGAYSQINLTVFGVEDVDYLITPTAATNPDPPIVNNNPNDPWQRYEEESSLASYFGRVNYSFDGKYLVTGSLRRDGSSRLSKDARWGTFPSFSLGWNVKQESFLENVDLLSSLKVRGGYGETGNVGSVSDPYSYWVRAKLLQQGDGSVGVVLLNANEDLHWEVGKQQNYGFDLGVLQNKLNFTFDYFIRKTEDMIVIPPITVLEPEERPRENIGTLKSHGIELALNYRNFEGDFKYEIGGNVTFYSKPIVEKLFSSDQEIFAGNAAKIQSVTRTAVGEEFASFWGLETDGLVTLQDIISDSTLTGGKLLSGDNDYLPGDLKYVDQNGDSVINNEDRVYLGSANPDYVYGININLQYKAFDLKIFGQGVQGIELVNTLNTWLRVPAEGDYNLLRSVLDGPKDDDVPSQMIPTLRQGGGPLMNSTLSDFYVENASYFRLKNIQLGYTLPQSITSKVKMSVCRIYISAENLFTITPYQGLDPEVGRNQAQGRSTFTPLAQGIDDATYPQPRRFLVGINISF